MRPSIAKRNARRPSRGRRGALSFEWILLVTLLTIGVVGGLTAARDAIISELGDVSAAVVAIDQSYSVGPDPWFHKNSFSFQDIPDPTNTLRPQGQNQGGAAQP